MIGQDRDSNSHQTLPTPSSYDILSAAMSATFRALLQRRAELLRMKEQDACSSSGDESLWVDVGRDEGQLSQKLVGEPGASGGMRRPLSSQDDLAAVEALSALCAKPLSSPRVFPLPPLGTVATTKCEYAAECQTTEQVLRSVEDLGGCEKMPRHTATCGKITFGLVQNETASREVKRAAPGEDSSPPERKRTRLCEIDATAPGAEIFPHSAGHGKIEC